jgi:hypothetical protein
MTIARVHYRERQRLTTADLRGEQDYRLALAGRHHLAHHEWGVVRGLRVVQLAGRFIVTPGVAIDGYGREIVVPEPIDIEGDFSDLSGCSFVLVYFCEYPEQAPPGRTCQEQPAPRTAQRPRAVISDTYQARPPFDDLGRARAAGAAPARSPWPVPLAQIGLTCKPEADKGLVEFGAARYVGHRVSVVRSPTRRARLQLGVSGRADVYHFLLSTADGSGALAHRLAIDRDGMTHIWKPLVVSGAVAAGAAAISGNRVIRFRDVPLPAGLGSRLRIVGDVNPETGRIRAALEELGGASVRLRPVLTADEMLPASGGSPSIKFGGLLPATLQLLDAVSLLPLRLEPIRRAARGRAARQEVVATPERFEAVLGPTGGRLCLAKGPAPQQARTVECGDVDRSRPDAKEPGTPVVQFRPAAAHQDDPLAREIYAVTTSAPDALVPSTELRLSGGAEDQSDVSTRIVFGAWNHATPAGAADVWVPRVRMDGGRRVDILATPDTAALKVNGTVYLPAIGREDPLLPEMLSMAFMAGLRQAGRISTATKAAVAVTGTPTIARGETLTYDLTITYPATAVLRRPVELIYGVTAPADLIFRTIPLPDDPLPAGGSPKKHTATLKNFTHRAGKVKLQVILLVAENDVPKLAIAPALELTVT